MHYDRNMRFLAPAVLLGLTLAPAPAQEQKPVLDPDAAGPAQRIWSDVMQESQELWLRRRFAIPKGARSARIAVSCDNECTIFVNGKRVATADDWEKLTFIDIEALRVGDNAIAVHAKNAGGPAALALWLTWIDAAGKGHYLVTDKNWRVSTVAAAGWEAPGFDDTKWQAAEELGKTRFAQTVYGYPPKGFVFVNRFTELAAAVERALHAMRSARNTEDALRSLDAIERAVMSARRKIRDQQKPKASKKR